MVLYSVIQGPHRLEKCSNIQDCLEKSLKIKFAKVFGDLNQYQIVVLLFGAAYAAPNKGTTIFTNFLKLIYLEMHSSISEVEF